MTQKIVNVSEIEGYLRDIENIANVLPIRALLDQSPSVSGEVFGYFKAEPFGWTDCSQSDDGAVALYETPQPDRVAELEAKLKVASEALEYWRKECSGNEPSISVFQVKVDEALAKIKE